MLSLYDPQRARGILRRGAPATSQGSRALGRERADRGAGLRFLLEPTSSLLLARLLDRIGARFPEARVTFSSPARSGAVARGADLAFGRPLQARHDLRRAEVILALDADFSRFGSVQPALCAAVLRAPPHQRSRSADEPTLCRGADAQPHREPRRSPAPAALERRSRVLAAVAAELAGLPDIAQAAPKEALLAALAPSASREERPLMRAIALDLARHPGAVAVIPGEWQSPETHALAHLCTTMLRSEGLVTLIDPTLVSLARASRISRLSRASSTRGAWIRW